MAITHFDTDIFQITHSTKEDGDYIAYSEGRAMTLLFPTGSSIALSDGSERIVHAQGIIVSRGSQGTWAIPTADCLPLIIIDESARAAGLLHLGWKEIYRGTARDFLREWLTRYPESAATLKVFFGPHICKNCFALAGPKGWIRIILFRFSALKKHLIKSDGHCFFDLKGAALEQLERAGISKERVAASSDCTFEHENLASCRREGLSRTYANFFSVTVK